MPPLTERGHTGSPATEQDVISLLNLQTQLHAANLLVEHKEAEVTRLRAALTRIATGASQPITDDYPDAMLRCEIAAVAAAALNL